MKVMMEKVQDFRREAVNLQARIDEQLPMSLASEYMDMILNAINFIEFEMKKGGRYAK